MSVQELADKIGVSRQLLNRKVNKGGVPGVSRTETGRLRITEGCLLDFWIAHERLKTTRRQFQRVPERKKWQLDRIMRLVRTITLLTGGDLKERAPKLGAILSQLPMGEALLALRDNKDFAKHGKDRLIRWVMRARTEQSFQLRCAVVEFKHTRQGAWEFTSQTQIAEMYGVSCAAVCKTLRKMPAINERPTFT